MTNLLRFDFNDRDGIFEVVENGDWVRATDYDALAAKHKELVSAVKDLLHDVRYIVLDEQSADGEGYELWEEIKKFRRVIHAAGLAELKGQDDDG